MRLLLETSVVEIVVAWTVSTVLFAALIIYIAKHHQKRTLPLKTIFIMMFVGGMAIYSTCHYWELKQAADGLSTDSSLEWVKNDKTFFFRFSYIIMHSVMDVGIMFYGRVNSSVFYKLDASKNPVIVFLFWAIHLAAFYTTASAILIRFGNDLLRWIRVMTSRISDVDLIFGVSADSLAFGRGISGRKSSILVYADNVIREDYDAVIRDLGGITYSSKEAVNASPSFLKTLRIKPGRARLRLYALSEDYDKNLHYALRMSEALKTAGIPSEQTELVLLGTEEWKGMFLQAGADQYGYGSVLSFEEYEMSARLLIHNYPLCDAIAFDENGRAKEDMNVLIIGFGRSGHEVMRKVIANGQFEGSSFHLTIYDPDFSHRTGFFRSQYPTMFANYDVSFEPHDGRSGEIFRFIQDNAASLKYIVVCLKDRDTARGIALHIIDRLSTMGCARNVYTCDNEGVRCYSHNVGECKTIGLYDTSLLYSGELDHYSRELNHRYSGGRSAEEDWKNCAYFDRMSSRASVDYLVPLIRRVKGEAKKLTISQMENLAKSEHLRWCAFHYTFGFDVMEKEDFAARLRLRQDEIREFGKSSLKATKDQKARTHVCLVEWDELDEISRIENAITGGSRNYKDSDRGNVDVVMELITEEEQL